MVLLLLAWAATALRPVGRAFRLRRLQSGSAADDSVGGLCDDSAERELLFQEVLNGYLETLAVSTKCSRALIYLQSEKEKILQVVCRFPSLGADGETEQQSLPEENEFVPLDCIMAADESSSDCIPKSSAGRVFDYPIVYREAATTMGAIADAPDDEVQPDYYGLLRVEYIGDDDAAAGMAQSDAVAQSIAKSLATSIKLEYLHFEHGCKLEAEVDAREEDEETKYSNAIMNGIWTTASNSIKTMRTMLKMLEKRNINEEDEIGRETYDNIQVQLESLGVSISPLMPSVYRSVKNVMDDYDDGGSGGGGDGGGSSPPPISPPVPVDATAVWGAADKEETLVELEDRE